MALAATAVLPAKRIKGGELLIVATNLDDADRSLNLYRKRWVPPSGGLRLESSSSLPRVRI